MKSVRQILIAALALAASSAHAAVTIHRLWHTGYADTGDRHRAEFFAGCPSQRTIVDGWPEFGTSAYEELSSTISGGFSFSGVLDAWVSTVRYGFTPGAGTTIWFDLEVTGQGEVAIINLSQFSYSIPENGMITPFIAYLVDTAGNAFAPVGVGGSPTPLPAGRYFLRLTSYCSKRGDILGNAFTIFAGTVTFSNMTLVPGSSQTTPILPTPIEPQPGQPPGSAGGSFSGVPSGRWYDPPLAQGYTFTATGTALFKTIMAFPSGIQGSYHVTTEGATYGPFTPEQSVNLQALRGHGVSSFVLKGIKPFVDATSPVAFPIMLDFTEATADFTMVPIAAPDLQMATLPNGNLSFTFDGVLQSSPDLATWTDVTPAPTSPYVIPKALATGARFFRSREP
jgi:hypothetical protein